MTLTIHTLRRAIRWLLPLIALLLFAAYLVISPIIASHAAPVTPPAHVQISMPVAPHGIAPHFLYRP